nr:hypothetical protein GCM10020093_020090 [Planobispora longispora]
MELKELLGDETPSLLGHECSTIGRERLHLPGPYFVDRVLVGSDRPRGTAQPAARLRHRPPGGTGYLSILPVDQGVEHSAAAPSPVGCAIRSPFVIIVMTAGTSQTTRAGYRT